MDIITSIIQKRAKAMADKKAYAEEARRRINAYDAEIAAYNEAISKLNAAASSLICPACHGEGVVKMPGGADKQDTETCSVCKGTGIKLT